MKKMQIIQAIKNLRLIGTRCAAGAICSLLAAAAVPAQAGFIEINFSASLQAVGAAPPQEASGQFILDDSVAFVVGSGLQTGLIAGGSINAGPTSGTVDTSAFFTFASAAVQSGGLGIINLIGDFGAGFFSLEIAGQNLLGSSNAFDAFAAQIALADLLSFDPNAAFSTRLVISDNAGNLSQGALTSLSFNRPGIPAPATIWLTLLAAPLLLRVARRAR